jgi:hypothetical protein
VTPIVDNDSTADNVTENVALGTTVGITAFSEDVDGTTNVVSYSLDDDAGGLFAIDGVTGVVTTAAAIDYETVGASTSITARATSTDGSTTTRAFTITFNDVDEFDVTPLVDTDAGLNQVSENAAPGTILGITAFSNDLDGTHNNTTYSLDNDAGGLFQIDSTSGVVSTLGAIDFEATGSTLNIVVRATSDDSSSTTAGFTITVNDVNEFNPVVNDQTFNINENTTSGTSVGTIIASDADTAQTLSYAVAAGNTNNAFVINSATGEITVNDQNELDRETTPQYLLTVQVTDSLAPTRSDTATVTIDINNVNEAPVLNPAGPFTLDENSLLGSVVGTVTSTDVDVADSAIYSITAGDAGGAFAINSSTGQITVANPAGLNFESLNSFALTVQVDDAGGLNDATTVDVNLNDVNEVPTDLALAGSIVDENSANGTAVGTVTGTDVDAGDVLTYSLTNSAGGRFAIDLNSGQVTVANASLLDFETAVTHSIIVQTTDSGGLQYSEAFSITLNNVNEAPVAADDTVTAQQTQTLNYNSSNVLINDTDVDGDALTAVLVAGPANGTLSLNPDGTFDYTPTGTFFGTDTFTYYTTDGALNSNVATVMLEVQPVGGGSTTTTDATNTTTDADSDTNASNADDMVVNGQSVQAASNSDNVSVSSDRRTTTQAGVPNDLRAETSAPLRDTQPVTEIFLDDVPEGYWGSSLSSVRYVADNAEAVMRNVVTTVFGNVVPDGPGFTTLFLELAAGPQADSSSDTVADLELTETLIVGSSVAVSTSFSVGYVVWMLRGGSLLTTFMSSLPAWQSFDALAVIDSQSTKKTMNRLNPSRAETPAGPTRPNVKTLSTAIDTCF